MEYDADDQNESGNWLDRIKQSPRTVSALIIILIVAAAIYAFSGNKQQTSDQALNMASPTPTQDMAQATATPTSTQTAASPAPTQVSQEDLQKVASSLPAEQKTDSAYVETAQKGDGLTQMARRATTRYLSENNVGYTVTNEQRIYIEDYVRRQMAQGHVMIGSTHEVSFSVLKDGVTKAGQLNSQQLHNLTKYVHVLQT